MRDPNFGIDYLEKSKKSTPELINGINKHKEPDDETKIELIEKKFKEIMEVLGLDLEDESLKGTPHRVAKMYVKELFIGLNEVNRPKISLFKNNYRYDQMIVEKDITLFSVCEHHFVPIVGKVHVAYYPADKLIGLSKLNRIVHYYSKKPQLQEKLCEEIAREIMQKLETEDVAVMIEADHLCVKSRGIRDVNSITITSSYNGKFNEQEIRNEFLRYIK
jgi:GTP cyclohydrolase I